MVTIEDIEKLLSDNCTDDEISELKTFHEILWAISFQNYSVDQLDAILQAVEELLPIAESLDRRHADAWPRWIVVIRKVRDILRKSFLNSAEIPPEYPNNKKHRYDKIGLRTIISCLVAELDNRAPSGILPAKAILLIGRYGRYVEQELEFTERFTSWSYENEDNLADTIRKCCNLKWKHLALAREYLPDWPSSSPEMWKKLFLEKAVTAPKYTPLDYLDRHDFIHTIQNILNYASIDKVNTPLKREHALTTATSEQPPSQNQNSSAVIQPYRERYSRSGRTLPVRPTFNYFQEQQTGVDANTDGLPPKTSRVVPQQDTPSDQPMQSAAVQAMEVRYSNYRTAMDNQRLPWAWDCLNRHEITVLVQALNDHAELVNASVPDKQGAFLLWLMLISGQSLDQILRISLVPAEGSYCYLLSGPTFRRIIYPPPKAFRPSKEQDIFLSGHADFVDLAIFPPFHSMIVEMGLTDSNIELIKKPKNIGAFLKLDHKAADKLVRQFLENHRTRDIRLLPGRIRNVLGAEVMRMTSDPVVTHLLTSLPTDMPPSGVYYTSYSQELLEHIYKEAVTGILRVKA